MLATVAASWLLSPEGREGSKRAKVAQLEFENYRIYDIGPDGVSRVLIADRGRHYDNREELENPILIQRESNRTEGISGLYAVIKEEVVNLKGSVHYWNDEGYNLFTEEAVYNRQTQVLKGRGGFTLEWAEGRMAGAEFVLDNVARTVDAKEVRAVLDMKE